MSPQNELDAVMEQASTALAKMDYLECEEHCLHALAMARGRGLWGYYARILLPLQEARRQRRMIAAEGAIRLGSTDLTAPASSWLHALDSGCILLTAPHGPAEAAECASQARQDRRYLEVLLADNPVEAPIWTLRTWDGVQVALTLPAPPTSWRNRWFAADKQADSPSSFNPPTRPADWFLDALEALGDAALAQVDQRLTGLERFAALEQRLLAVPDHEILHQRLADAARNLTA